MVTSRYRAKAAALLLGLAWSLAQATAPILSCGSGCFLNTGLGPLSSAAAAAPSAGWYTLKVGAGGFVRGLNVAADGTTVARTDTNGAFYYTGSTWIQLFNANSLPSAFINATDIGLIGQGCFEIQIAPTNTQIFYAVYDGYVWVSSNRGATWTQTAFSQDVAGMNPNDGNGQYGPKMAIDPHNSNIVFVGTENNGLYFTTNGGTSWTQVSTSSLPVGSSYGITGIVFNGNGTVTGGATQTIYAASYGNGVYVSNNAGSTWTLTSGGPTIINTASIDSSGNYYAGTGAGLYKYSAGAWSTLFTDGNGAQALAINPYNNSEMAAINPAGWVSVSYNAGSTWSGYNFVTTPVSSDIPWIASANGTGSGMYLSAGGAAFSPTTNGHLILTAGTGTWQGTIPSSGFTSSTAYSWNDFSAGIEQLVANAVLIPPTSGSTPVLAAWDRPFFNITSLTSYPSTYGPVASAGIVAGWSLDYASATPTFIVGIADWNSTEQSGYSTNNGASWTAFPSFPASNLQGGTIAASTTQNIIWAPAGGQQPYYTTNQGSSWTGITISGISSWTGFQNAYYLNQRSVTADRVSANTFYLYFPGNGVYSSTNSGATWTQQLSGYIESNHSYAGYNSTLLSVPGNAGHLFYTPGNQTGTTPTSGSPVPFYRSTNSGATWAVVSNVTGVTAFTFGAIAPTKTYPSIYIFGFVSGVYGMWVSIDNASTWTNLGNPNTALETLSGAGSIGADPNNFGYVYVGLGGGGFGYYHP